MMTGLGKNFFNSTRHETRSATKSLFHDRRHESGCGDGGRRGIEIFNDSEPSSPRLRKNPIDQGGGGVESGR